MKLLKHPLTSLIVGIIIGVVVCILMYKKQPEATQFDPKPYQDSIKVLKVQKAQERAEGDQELHKADSIIASLRKPNKKLKDGLQAIAVFTPDSRTRFNDSVAEIAERVR